MDIKYYKKFEPIDGKWYIVKTLGSGSFGTVFEIERRDFSHAKSALKIITIPSTSNEVNSYREDNYDLDEKSVRSYFYGFVEEFTNEFKIMSKLRGNSNIVSIEDYDVIEHESNIGWDIFIRMELLTPVNKYFREHELRQRDIIKLGIDICKALEICQKYKIIHRDIKPSNIFVSDTGDFKLGDFGIARTLEKTSSGLSKKGTYTYMAPEIYTGGEYGSNVDIYSLGIVMYKLLNNNFEPFRTERTHNDEEAALFRRLKGEKMPNPINATGRLAEIILKACNFNPKERYESPLRFRQELENIYYTESEAKIIYPKGEELDYETTTDISANDKTVGILEDLTVVESEDENSKTVSIESKEFDITEHNLKSNQLCKDTNDKDNKKKAKIKLLWKVPLIVIISILMIMVLFIGSRVILGIIFSSPPPEGLVQAYKSEIKFVLQNNEVLLYEDQIISIEPQYLEEHGNNLLFELSIDGAEAFSNASKEFTGQPIGIYVDNELVLYTRIIGDEMQVNTIVLSVNNKDDLGNIVEKLGISNQKTVSAYAVARDFQFVNNAVIYIKSDENKYKIFKEKIDLLADILEEHNDIIHNGIIDKIDDYYDLVNELHPAWDELSIAMSNTPEDESSVQNTVNPEETSDTAEVNIEQEQTTAAKDTSQTTTSTKNTNETTKQKNEQQQEIPRQTEKQPEEQIERQPQQSQEQPQPQEQSQPEPQEQQNTVCPVCGSKYHTVHPSSDAPVINKEFD